MPGFFYLHFIQVFVYTREKLPRLDKIISFVKYASLLSSAVAIILFEIYFDIFWGFNVINITLIFTILVAIVSLFFIYKIKDVSSRYVVRGSVLLFVACIIGVSLLVFNVHNNIPQYIMQSGIVIQILVFAIGLGKKIRQTEMERNMAQQKLIQQLLENEALQTKVNRELEQKVKERTFQILQQKEEIQAQNEHLEQANIEITTQKQFIEKAHKNMMASITYASRIQNAILPKRDILNQFLGENFILFKPRDIVSGDFYWFKQVNNLIFVAAADCTGHGVPGAFMSMLGLSQLNEIVNIDSTPTADKVLNDLRKRIKIALHQQNEDNRKNNTQDGLDIAFCIINKQTNTVEFAGANNPLYLIRQNNTLNYELIETKADKMPIGVYPKDHLEFTKHTIKLQQEDRLYLFSDGFVSQSGGDRLEKFKAKRLKEILITIQENDMPTQKQILEQTLTQWQGNNEQVDDILIIGIKFKTTI